MQEFWKNKKIFIKGINGFLFDTPMRLSLTAQEVNNCSEKIVNCLLHLEKNRNIIKVFSQKIRETVLENWTWHQRSKDWKEISSCLGQGLAYNVLSKIYF